MEGLSRAGRVLGCMAFGVLVGVVGAVVHRYRFGEVRLPIGIIGGLLLVFFAGVACRAWMGYLGLLGFGVGWVAVVQLMSLNGPGGDLLIASETIGYVWIYGGLAIIAITAFLPNSWFSDQPVRRRRRRGATVPEPDAPAPRLRWHRRSLDAHGASSGDPGTVARTGGGAGVSV